MDWGDLLIIGVPIIIIGWLGWELWKYREDYWVVKASFVVTILFVGIAGGYLIANKEHVKRGDVPLLHHPTVQNIKARINGKITD